MSGDGGFVIGPAGRESLPRPAAAHGLRVPPRA